MGEIAIGCVPSTVYYFVTRVINLYRGLYPKIRIRVLDASANDVLLAVARGDVEFGINFIGTQEGDVEFEPLFEEPFVAACRRDHPLATKKQVSWTELAQYDYISVDKSSGNRLLLDQALAGLAGMPQSMYETQHGTTVIGLVEAGLGVAAVPSMAMPTKDHPLLVSIPLINPVVTRKVGLIRRRNRDLSPAAQQFYNLCQSMRGMQAGNLVKKNKKAKK